MAVANKEGSLVLATGNKSELAVGYCTLYGDMSGALSVLGDLLKTDAWSLARWMNQNHEACGFDSPPIPINSIEKPPSAELRPDQCDQDSLPPYEQLDQVIRCWVEREMSVDAIADQLGMDMEQVRHWTGLIDRNEHKRNQAAVVLKISPRAFGSGRLMPIAARDSSANRDAGATTPRSDSGYEATRPV